MKAPRSWPKSSLSISVRRDRGAVDDDERPAARAASAAWSARASSSLPVPVSPVSSTVARNGATPRISARSLRMARLSPTSSRPSPASPDSLTAPPQSGWLPLHATLRSDTSGERGRSPGKTAEKAQTAASSVEVRWHRRHAGSVSAIRAARIPRPRRCGRASGPTEDPAAAQRGAGERRRRSPSAPGRTQASPQSRAVPGR